MSDDWTEIGGEYIGGPADEKEWTCPECERRHRRNGGRSEFYAQCIHCGEHVHVTIKGSE